jgi:thiosulfate/3-mercaptopyruvate sulfurtransferase
MNDTALKAWLENQGFPTANSLQQTLHGRIAYATTPLMYAARLGRIGYIGDLLSRGADPREMNADGNGALWFACFAGSAPCVNALIKAGAPLDSQNVNGATALIYAASAGKIEIVRLLLDAGADATLETLDGFTALDVAATRACLVLLRDSARQLQAA